MPRFIAVHTIPITEKQWKPLAKELVTNIPKGFSWKLTYCAFKDSKLFCEWQAPTKKALEDWLVAHAMDFDHVYPVKLYNVARGKME